MSKLVLIFFFLSTVHCFTHDALVNSLYQYVQDGSEQQKVNNQNDIQLNDSFKRAHLISYDIPQIDYDFIHNILGQAVPKSNTDFDLPLASIEPGHNTQSNSLLTESNTNTDSTLTVPKLTYDIPNVDNDFINNFVTKDFSNSNKETPILISDNVNQGTSSSSTSSSTNPENKISVISTLDQIFKNLDDLLVNQEVLDTDDNNKYLFLNDDFNIESVQNLNAIQNQLDQDLENIIDSVLIGKSETDPVEFELDPTPQYEIHEILLDHVSPSSVLPEPEAETLSPLQIQENHQQHLQAQIQSETESKNNQHQTDQTILSNNNDELIEIGDDAEHSYENLFFKINEEDFKYPLPHFQPHVVEIYNPSAPEYTSHSETEEVEGTDLNSDIDNFLQNHLNNEINNFVNNDNINLNNDVISGEDDDEILHEIFSLLPNPYDNDFNENSIGNRPDINTNVINTDSSINQISIDIKNSEIENGKVHNSAEKICENCGHDDEHDEIPEYCPIDEISDQMKNEIDEFALNSRYSGCPLLKSITYKSDGNYKMQIDIEAIDPTYELKIKYIQAGKCTLNNPGLSTKCDNSAKVQVFVDLNECQKECDFNHDISNIEILNQPIEIKIGFYDDSILDISSNTNSNQQKNKDNTISNQELITNLINAQYDTENSIKYYPKLTSVNLEDFEDSDFTVTNHRTRRSTKIDYPVISEYRFNVHPSFTDDYFISMKCDSDNCLTNQIAIVDHEGQFINNNLQYAFMTHEDDKFNKYHEDTNVIQFNRGHSSGSLSPNPESTPEHSDIDTVHMSMDRITGPMLKNLNTESKYLELCPINGFTSSKFMMVPEVCLIKNLHTNEVSKLWDMVSDGDLCIPHLNYNYKYGTWQYELNLQYGNYFKMGYSSNPDDYEISCNLRLCANVVGNQCLDRINSCNYIQ